jgi:O-antigen/teichoic acid export membrane protein
VGPRALKNNAIFIATHAITFIANISLTIIIARYLHVEEFVDYTQVSSFMNMIVPVCTFGLIPFVIRQFNNGNNRDFDLRYVSINIFLIGAALSLVSVVIYFLFGGVGSIGNMFLTYSVIILTALGLVSNSVARVQRRPWNYFFIGAVGRAISIILIGAAFVVSDSWRSIQGILICTSVGLALPLLLTRFRWLPPAEEAKEKNRTGIITAFHFVFPITLSNMVVMSTPFLERVILKSSLADFEIAQYVFNYDLALKSLAIITIFLKLLVYPSIVTGDPEEESRRFRLLMKLTILGSVAAFFIIALSSYFYVDAMRYLTGSIKYANRTIFILVGGYSLIFIMNYIVTIGVMLTGKTRSLLYGSCIFTALHVVGISILPQYFGAVGVCCSLIASQVIATLFCYYSGGVRSLSYV